MSFCALSGLSSKATSGYIDGLKFYAVGLGGIATIPGFLVISRMLDGLAKLGKRPSPKKLGIESDLVRRMVAELRLMDLSVYDLCLFTVLFSIA